MTQRLALPTLSRHNPLATPAFKLFIVDQVLRLPDAKIPDRFIATEPALMLAHQDGHLDEALRRFWYAARLAAIEECMDALRERMNHLFSNSRVHDSAESMRCLGVLRQVKAEHVTESCAGDC